jgi:hypothetical protein
VRPFSCQLVGLRKNSQMRLSKAQLLQRDMQVQPSATPVDTVHQAATSKLNAQRELSALTTTGAVLPTAVSAQPVPTARQQEYLFQLIALRAFSVLKAVFNLLTAHVELTILTRTNMTLETALNAIQGSIVHS